MDAEDDVLAVEITDTGTGDSSGLDLLLPQVGKELSKNNFYKLTCPDSMKGWMRTKLESQRSSGH
jgi:hypothetical protein